jgi:hypothetical protein
VVLTPEFCKTKINNGSFISSPTFPLRKESFGVGEAACRQMEQKLRFVFASITRVESESAARQSRTDIILIPRFVGGNATRPGGPIPAFSDRELIIFLEWTAKNLADKSLWVETVQGSATRKMGNVFTKDKKKMVAAAVADLLEASAKKLSGASELLE